MSIEVYRKSCLCSSYSVKEVFRVLVLDLVLCSEDIVI